MATDEDLDYIPKMFDDLAKASSFNQDSWKVWNYPLAAIDDTVTSVGWIGTLGAWDAESVVPGSENSSYHRSREGFSAVATIPMLFASVGVGTRAARAGQWADDAARVAGMASKGGKFRNAIYSQTAIQAQRDKLIADGMVEYSATASGLLARGGFAMPDVKDAAMIGTYGVASTGELVGASQNFRRVQAVKEALWQEAAVFGLMNQNELLFPEYAAAWQYVVGAGFGVGVNVAVETAIGARIWKGARLSAALEGAWAARKVPAFTERNALQGVVGEEYNKAMASVWGFDRAMKMEADASNLANNSASGLNALTYRQGASEAMQMFNDALDTSISNMFKVKLPGVAFQKGHGNVADSAISRVMDTTMAGKFTPYDFGSMVKAMNERAKFNINAVAGVAELADPGITGRFAATRIRYQTDLDSALVKLGAAKTPQERVASQLLVDAAQKNVDDLDLFRGATIERDGTPNFNAERVAPAWERREVRGAMLRDDGTPDSVYLSYSGARKDHLLVKNDGGFAKFDRSGKSLRGNPISASKLTYDEITEAYTAVAKLAGGKAGAAAKWQTAFWDNLVKTPNADLSQISFPVLDAIHEGLMKIPSHLAQHPNAANLARRLSGGEFKAASLGGKLDWMRDHYFRHQSQGETLDAFDLSKALNLPLTDAAGRPTTLHDAFIAFGQQNATLGSTFMKGNVNDRLDDLFDLGFAFGGRAGAMSKTLMQADFNAALNTGLKNFTAHEQVGGIGAIYHSMKLPSDSEVAMARVAEVRNVARQQTLLNSQSTFVKGGSQELMRDPIMAGKVLEVGTIWRDPNMRANYITTTMFQQRVQPVNQAAHIIGQNMQRYTDRVKLEMIQPIAKRAQELRLRNQHTVPFAEMSAARNIISRGVALKDDFFVVGRNEIDVSNPGAQKMLELLGPLQSAPGAGAKWEMFDIAVAATTGRYVPIELGDDAVEMLNGLTKVSYHQLHAINALKDIQGLTLLTKRNGRLPAVDARRFKFGYVQDPETGSIVGFVRGPTQQDVDRELAAVLDGLNANRTNNALYIPADNTHIQSYFDATDSVFLSHMTDFSGIKNTGTSGGRNLDFRVDASADGVEDMLLSARNGYDDLKNRTIAANFSSAFAEMDSVKQRIGSTVADKDKMFWDSADQWKNLLFASDQLAPNSLAKRGHQLVEDVAGNIGEIGASLKERVWAGIWELTTGQPVPLAKPLSKAEKAAAQDLMAKYPPFAALSLDEVRQAAKLTEGADSFKLARNLQQWNRTTVKLVLQHANLAHPMLNAIGMLSTTPPVLKALQVIPGETVQAWKMRVGAVADYLGPNGVATLSPGKLLMEAQHIVTSDPSAMAYAAKYGYLNANFIEELNKVIAIKPNGATEAIDKFLKMTDFINHPINKVRKMLGKTKPDEGFTLSERSEEWSRAVMHMAGVALARRSGQMDEAAQHAFGHHFANQNIADFAPNIRGEAFRGVAGIPFGLFQSFAINALQRSFTYIEDANKRAFVTQMLAQGLVFGANGIPGWPLLNAMFFNTKDIKADERGATSLNERLYQTLGKENADILLNGTISGLPQLLGASTGLNMYGSGDMNPRLPTTPPSIGVITQGLTGVYKVIGVAGDELAKTFDDRAADPGRLAEIIANYAPSRGMRSLADLALGERVDRNGNLVMEDTRSGMGLVSRILGMRTTNEDLLSRAIWSNSVAASQRTSDMNYIRSSMARELRAAGGKLDPDSEAAWYAKYLSAGGRSDQWKRWMQTSLEKALYERGDRRLDALVNKDGQVFPHNIASVARLLAAGAEMPVEPAVE